MGTGDHGGTWGSVGQGNVGGCGDSLGKRTWEHVGCGDSVGTWGPWWDMGGHWVHGDSVGMWGQWGGQGHGDSVGIVWGQCGDSGTIAATLMGAPGPLG